MGGYPAIQTPALYMLDDDQINLSDYLDDPTDPVLCVPEQYHDPLLEIVEQKSRECSWRTRVYHEFLAHVSRARETDLGSQDAFCCCFSVHA